MSSNGRGFGGLWSGRKFLMFAFIVAVLLGVPKQAHSFVAIGPNFHNSVRRLASNAASCPSSGDLPFCLWAKSEPTESHQDFFIREAIIADMGEAARILTDGFYGDVNPLRYFAERLRTYLSLESDFPNPNDQHVVLVACRQTDGKVLAVCDADNRLRCDPRPYMCNLAVDNNWRNQGLAKTLIVESERIIAEQWRQTEVFLKVRESNQAALSLYKKLGYKIETQGTDPKTFETLFTMKKDLTSSTPLSALGETEWPQVMVSNDEPLSKIKVDRCHRSSNE